MVIHLGNISAYLEVINISLKYDILTWRLVGRDNSVGKATVWGSDAGGGRDFPHPSIPALGGPPSLLYNEYRVFPEGKTAGAWR
jgi:hypothetical protein